ncbi:MAG: HAD family hydrolase [Candidatus Bathyarchaeota archaeon]|nr:MAG: HAD family hydrolase [Candidatus Bathyarchaeota archaeon]
MLFDLEDTLIQTPWADPEQVTIFRQKTRRILIELGVPSTVLSGIERSTIMRNKASEYIEQKCGEKEANRIKREIDNFLAGYERDSARKSELFPDSIPTLKNLRNREVKIGLVTNTSARVVENVFRRFDLARFFDVVITRERVRRMKPDPEGVLLALERLGARRFFMVGDLMFDVIAAKSADGVAILVIRPEQTNSQHLYKGLSAEVERTMRINRKSDLQPDYVVKSLVDVPEIIQSVCI